MSEITTRNASRRKSDTARMAATRTGTTAADLKASFLETLLCGLGRRLAAATPNDAYVALALAVRDRVLAKGVNIRPAISCDTPGPVSLTTSFAPSPCCSSSTIKRPPSGMASRALINRFTSTVRTWAASTWASNGACGG